MTSIRIPSSKVDLSDTVKAAGRRLAEHVGIHTPEAENWLSIAAIHPSAAGVEITGGLTGYQLDMLRSVGKDADLS